MIKKQFTVVSFVIIVVLLASCSSDKNIVENYTFSFKENGIDVISKENKDLIITNAIFSDDSYYFTVKESENDENGEPIAVSSVFSADSKSQKIELIFSDRFASNYEDKIHIKGDILIYQNQSNSYLKAIDLKKLSELDTYKIPEDAGMRYYSSDLNTILDTYSGGLNIQKINKEKKFFSNTDGGGYSTINWAKDDSNCVFYTGENDQINFLNTSTMEINKINAEDYTDKLNGVWVDLIQCYSNSNGEIAVNYLCEETTDILLIDKNGKYLSKISSDWDSVIYDMNNNCVVYAVKNNNGTMGLYSFDLKTKNKKVLVTNELFTSATLISNSIIYSGRKQDGTAIIRKIEN